MLDDSILRALMTAADSPEYDEVFARLARGQLSEAEVESLRTSADPETRRLYELFRPLDEKSKHRFDDALSRAFASSPPLSHTEVPRSSQTRPQIGRRWLRPAALVGIPLAAAASLALYLALLRPTERQLPAPPTRLLPFSDDRVVSYSESEGMLLGSDRASSKEVELAAGSCWGLKLRMANRSQAPAVIRTFFLQGSTAQAWHADFVPQQDGVITPKGGCAKLPVLAPGRWRAVVLSGSELPDSNLEAAATTCISVASVHATWRCDPYPMPIRIVPPADNSLREQP